METLQEYRQRLLEAATRRDARRLRKEYWEHKAADARFERRDLSTRPWG
jgi:hypothetical protein